MCQRLETPSGDWCWLYFPKINVFVLICRTLGVLRPANWARLHGTFLRPGILESLNKITVGRFKAVHECFRLHCVILHGFWLKTQQRCSGSPARASDLFFLTRILRFLPAEENCHSPACLLYCILFVQLRTTACCCWTPWRAQSARRMHTIQSTSSVTAALPWTNLSPPAD